MNLQDVYLAEELRRNKIIEDNIILLRVVRFSYNSFFYSLGIYIPIKFMDNLKKVA
jgi:hypothetical protein